MVVIGVTVQPPPPAQISIWEALTKSLPLTVIIVSTPAGVVAGEMEVRLGLLTEIVWVGVVAVPFATCTLKPAVEVTRFAGTAAMSWVEFTNVVTSEVLDPVGSHTAVEVLMKFVPFRVSVKAALPTPTSVGDIDVRVGAATVKPRLLL